MDKKQDIFICTSCGHKSRKWLGQCPDCGEWDSLNPTQASVSRPLRSVAPVFSLKDARTAAEPSRLSTGISELDRTLGGGIVPGAMILLGGDPGIGKSTLILQLLAALAAQGLRLLYVSGEESVGQITMRAERLGIHSEHILLAAENSVQAIVALAEEVRPAFLAVDSIQTVYSEEVSSSPGSVSQVRESTSFLLNFAKRTGLPIILTGHVTKDGSLAGPKVLEHMVDTVLYFEGRSGQIFRMLRTVKNRFGSTNEVGVFEMKENGLVEVDNPSALFLAERPVNVPGSVVMPSVEGTRPILVEVQALVSPSSFGSTGRRTAIGADPQRLALLTAVLEKKIGLRLFDHDIFLNIAGGIRIDEPALDLGVIVALLSSLYEKTVDPTTVVCGEVGLAGELRAVGHMEMRLREAHRLGFRHFLMPDSSSRQLESCREMQVQPVRTVHEVVEKLFAPQK
jgi:DNA repair protein RadA/Sms